MDMSAKMKLATTCKKLRTTFSQRKDNQ